MLWLLWILCIAGWAATGAAVWAILYWYSRAMTLERDKRSEGLMLLRHRIAELERRVGLEQGSDGS